jgi:GR25 family glycosyltransferase involved in LPS biosynthesis
MTPLYGYYLNLDKRTDRDEMFKRDILSQPFLAPLKRMSAILNAQNGSLGCALSHLHALQTLLAEEEATHKNAYVAIFEDDFCILQRENFQRFVEAFHQIKEASNWDIITLTPRGDTVPPEDDQTMMTQHGFRRIINNQTATGYILKIHMLPILIQNFKAAVKDMLYGKPLSSCAIDQYWKRLQHTYKFYYYKHIFGGQTPGWSDLERKQVNYNVRFINQQ